MQNFINIINDEIAYIRQVHQPRPPSWPNEEEKKWALTFVPSHQGRHLNQLESLASRAWDIRIYNPLEAATIYQSLAEEWLKIAKEVRAINEHAGLILLKSKALYFYSCASSDYLFEIRGKRNQKIKVPLHIYDKCLTLKIITCAFPYIVSDDTIRSTRMTISELDGILNGDLGAHAAGMLFLKLAKWSSGLGSHASLPQLLYGYAAKNLKSDFYNISNPYNQIFKDYQEALCGEWDYVVILKDLANQGEGDLNYCLDLEKTVGDEIEQISARLLLFHSQGYSVPNIAFAGNNPSTIPQNQNLRYRRKPW